MGKKYRAFRKTHSPICSLIIISVADVPVNFQQMEESGKINKIETLT